MKDDEVWNREERCIEVVEREEKQKVRKWESWNEHIFVLAAIGIEAGKGKYKGTAKKTEVAGGGDEEWEKENGGEGRERVERRRQTSYDMERHTGDTARREESRSIYCTRDYLS